MIPTPSTKTFACSPIRCGRAALVVAALLAACVAFGQNLVQNPGFESGTVGWFGFGPVSLSSSTLQPRTGVRSALVENRTNPWNGVAQSFLVQLQPGTDYTLSAWVRLVSGGNEPVLLTMQKVDGGGTSYQTIASGSAGSTGWTQLAGTYTLAVSGTLSNLTLYLEGPAADVDFYADDFLLEAVPSYDWESAANARIEQIRKRDVQLRIVDSRGDPVPGTTIDIRQTRHRFAFGSAINGNIANPDYAAFFRTHFEWAVMENESKWYANEPSRNNVTYASADSITNFCSANGITMRGHCLFWAVENHVQSWVTNLSDADLRVHLTNRLEGAIHHFQDSFVHWDVNNEMLHGNYFGDRLGNWVNPWMFQHARALNTNVTLFVNDYNVLSGNETDAYKQQILNLIASNAPVDAIGAQGHFGATVNPLLTETRLDSLAELALPIWVTEYDSLNPDESVRADNLETLYRLAFSKPAVEGVLMWGFWAGSHWRGSNACIVDLDWTLNAAGERYQALLAEWTTMTNGVSGGDGRYDFRGFHGSYDITITPPGGQPTLRRIVLEPGAGPQEVALIAHSSGSSPLLHPLNPPAAGEPFQFQLTGDAGRTFAIQASSGLSFPGWETLTNLPNPWGTISFTNPANPPPPQQFFRARLLP